MLRLFSLLNKELLTIGGTSNDVKMKLYCSNDQVNNASIIGQSNASLYIVTPCNIQPYVGIGTVTPQANLHVQGNVLINSNLTVASNEYVYGTTFTNRITITDTGIFSSQFNPSTPQNVTVGPITCTTINTQNSGINAGSGSFISGPVTCTTINTQNNSINAGSGTIIASNVGIGVTNPSSPLQVAGTTIQAYPPAAMSSYLTNLTSSGYGVGNYIATASSEYPNSGTGYVYTLFDKVISGTNYWQAGNGSGAAGTTYNASSPYNHIGNNKTVDISGNSYSGEWVQLQMPVSIILSSYSIQLYVNTSSGAPQNWYILGSRDGIRWTLVDQRTSVTYTTSLLSYTISTSQAFSYYRMVISQLSAANVNGVVFTEWILNGTLQGISVISDGKLGTGVVTPTRTLEVAGDVICGGTMSAGNPLMFRNRIINGDFRVAQRGIGPTSYSSTAGYGDVDRWYSIYITSGTFSVAQSFTVPLGAGFSNSYVQSMSVSTTANDYGATIQLIEGYNLYDLHWGTSYGIPVTFSFWTMITNVSAGSILPIALRYSGSLVTYYFNTSYTVSAPNAWQYVSITIPPPPSDAGPFTAAINTVHTDIRFVMTSSGATGAVTSGTWTNNYNNKFTVTGCYNLASTTGWSRYITGVQLEKGLVATPFEYRPYSTELQLCQRYYQQWGPTVGSQRFGIAVNNGTVSYLMLPYFALMRVSPTSISVSSAAHFNILGGSAPTSITLDSTSTTIGSVILNFASSVGSGATLLYGVNAAGYIGLSAEL